MKKKCVYTYTDCSLDFFPLKNGNDSLIAFISARTYSFEDRLMFPMFFLFIIRQFPWSSDELDISDCFSYSFYIVHIFPICWYILFILSQVFSRQHVYFCGLSFNIISLLATVSSKTFHSGYNFNKSSL